MTTPTTPATAATSDAPRITGSTRLALLMHGHRPQYTGKMGFGLLRYSPGTVTSVIDADEAGGSLREFAGIDSDAPIVADAEAAAAIGADVLVIAVATSGGVLPAGYRSEIVTALRSGMSLINGLHGRFAEDPEFAAALQPGAFIWDVRREPEGLVSGTGRARALSCRRILTVGTDMALCFSLFEVAGLTLAVFCATLVSIDGESNWLEGAQLLAVYVVIALGCFYTISGPVAGH